MKSLILPGEHKISVLKKQQQQQRYNEELGVTTYPNNKTKMKIVYHLYQCVFRNKLEETCKICLQPIFACLDTCEETVFMLRMTAECKFKLS